MAGLLGTLLRDTRSRKQLLSKLGPNERTTYEKFNNNVTILIVLNPRRSGVGLSVRRKGSLDFKYDAATNGME